MNKPRSLNCLLAALLMTMGFSANAQIHKCQVNGAVHYQQAPCHAKEERPKAAPTVEELNAQRQMQLALEKGQAKPPRADPRLSAAPDAPTAADPARAPATPRSSFSCDGRKYCSQMTSCDEAKYFFAHCPGVKMDNYGHGNGVPCERQWCGR